MKSPTLDVKQYEFVDWIGERALQKVGTPEIGRPTNSLPSKKPFGATSRSNIAADYGPFLAGPILDITGELIADGSIASFF
jgi:hypothetical protein